MHKARMEAFSDGVIAIIITIMVLELKAPHDVTLSSLVPILPVLVSYGMSFVFIGIYWNNHHHLCQAITSVNGQILWANLHLLFWLSLIPFVTSWVDENLLEPVPVALYGVVLLMSGIAYYILTQLLLSHHGKKSTIATAIGSDFKGKLSVGIYASAIPVAFWNSVLAFSLYVLVAIIWFIPDRRIEKIIQK